MCQPCVKHVCSIREVPHLTHGSHMDEASFTHGRPHFKNPEPQGNVSFPGNEGLKMAVVKKINPAILPAGQKNYGNLKISIIRNLAEIDNYRIF
jgi:hypothetical protein